MIDIEEQKKNFKDHVAKFYDCGTIKILDFQKPGSNHYRIRFLFEEDCYRLHISGDLGELTAKNATNMRYEKFAEDFSNNIGYFTQKIECHSRPIYEYDEDEARKQLIEKIREYNLDVGEDNEMEEWLNRMLVDFDDEKGISNSGYEALQELDSDAWEYAHNIGKVPTGILHLYMLAFKLAQEDLKKRESELDDKEMLKRNLAYAHEWDAAIESRGDSPLSDARVFLALAIKLIEEKIVGGY